METTQETLEGQMTNTQTTREKVGKLIEEGVSARRIADTLGIGYSTVMRYKREILLEKEQENNTIRQTKRLCLKGKYFDVRVIKKPNNDILYNLEDLSSNIKQIVGIDITNQVRKVTEQGEDYIFEAFLLPISNTIVDFDFTESVKDILFKRSNVSSIQEIILGIDRIKKFIEYDYEEKENLLNEEQDNLLLKIDETNDIEQLTDITTQIKEVREKVLNIIKERELKNQFEEYLQEKQIDLEQIEQALRQL